MEEAVRAAFPVNKLAESPSSQTSGGVRKTKTFSLQVQGTDASLSVWLGDGSRADFRSLRLAQAGVRGAQRTPSGTGYQESSSQCRR